MGEVTTRESQLRALDRQAADLGGEIVAGGLDLDDLSGLDGREQDLSRCEILLGLYQVVKDGPRDWRAGLFGPDWTLPVSAAQSPALAGDADERLEILADPLRHPGRYTAACVALARGLFESLLEPSSAQSTAFEAALTIYAESVLHDSAAEASFKNYFHTSWWQFSNRSIEGRGRILNRSVARALPSVQELRLIAPLLGDTEFAVLTELCFLKNAAASFALFEQSPYPFSQATFDTGASGILVNHDGKVYERYWQATGQGGHFQFPSLSQKAPYAERMRQLYDFLGTLILSLDKAFNDSRSAERFPTQLKKYEWVGGTEVFVLDSQRPGPVTLVFAPHFHEDNPRRAFHWMKDLPLESGAVVFIPEANRAMAQLGQDTRAMNVLFPSSLESSRVDHLVLRRVQRVMGLVDGFIGVHDSKTGPFFVSDAGVTPEPSAWVHLLEDGVHGAHWQLAAKARETMKAIEGMSAYYAPQADYDGGRLDEDPSFAFFATQPAGATGYMNVTLNKPAMTFEGKKSADHGALHAAAQYALLRAYGHDIDSEFETRVFAVNPTPEPALYEGLAPSSHF